MLALELLIQAGDLPVFVVAGSAGAGLEGGCSVLEELLLPALAYVWGPGCRCASRYV